MICRDMRTVCGHASFCWQKRRSQSVGIVFTRALKTVFLNVRPFYPLSMICLNRRFWLCLNGLLHGFLDFVRLDITFTENYNTNTRQVNLASRVQIIWSVYYVVVFVISHQFVDSHQFVASHQFVPFLISPGKVLFYTIWLTFRHFFQFLSCF